MTLSLRLIVTVTVAAAAAAVVSFIAGFFWRYLFDVRIPSYLSGLVGGLATIPVWEFPKKH